MRKRPFILFVATFLTGCVGCSHSEPVTTDDQLTPMHVDDHESKRQTSSEATRKREAIAAALESLLKRPNDDAFLICSHANSQEYVQFATNEQGLLLDLPTIPLDSEQRKQAITFFNSIGVSVRNSEMLDELGEQTVGKMQFFQVDLERDADRGAKLALDVFEEVYQLPIDFPLAIEEN